MSGKREVRLLIVSLLAPASAMGSPDVVGADVLGAGAASLAAGRSNAAITSNPGLLALHRRYDFSAQFAIGPDRGLHWGVGGMDGKTLNNFGFGVMYQGDRYEPALRVDELPGWAEPGAPVPNMKRTHDVAVGMATSFAGDRVSVGAGGNITFYDNDRQGTGQTGNVDVGLGVRPVEWLTLGAAATDLIPIDPLGERVMRVGGGLRLDSDAAAAEVDGGYRHDGVGGAWFAGGAELRPKSGRIRAGYRWERPQDLEAGERPEQLLTGGLGVESEGGALEYAIHVPVGGGTFASTTHVIGIRFGAPPGLDPDAGAFEE